MICDDASLAIRVYGCCMASRLRVFLFLSPVSALFSALSAQAAADESGTGIVDVGPAMIIFVLAALLLLTLLFRATHIDLTGSLSGKLGRIRVRRALQAVSRDVLHDFILPGAYGGLAKIDHAILTAGGILCVRTVSHGGVVFGTEDEAQWSSIKGPRRRRFLNPLIQNEGRRRAVQKALPGAPVANLVVFTGAVEFKSPMPKNVIHLDELESFVAKFVFGPSRVDDWDAIWLSLKAAALDSSADRKDYAAQIGFS